MNQDAPQSERDRQASAAHTAEASAMQGKADGGAVKKNKSACFGRRLWWLALLPALLAIAAGWVGWTQSGTATLLNLAQVASAGQLSFTDVSGRLLDELRIGELRYQTATLHVKAGGVAMRWQAPALLRGKLSVQSLQIAALQIETLEDKTPASLPANLNAGIDIALEQAAIGRLSIASFVVDGRKFKVAPVITLTGITALLQSNQSQHHLQASVKTDFGQVGTRMTIATQRPFKTQAEFDYRGQPDVQLPEIGVAGSLSGSLEELRVNAKAKLSEPLASTGANAVVGKAKMASTLQGELSAVLAPFSRQAVRTLRATISGFNPAEFAAQAPVAHLNIAADLQPVVLSADSKSTTKKSVSAASSTSTELNLAGKIQVSNSQPSRFDQNGLPFTKLTSAIAWSGDHFSLDQTQMQLAGKGRVAGAAQVQLLSSGLPLIDARFDVSDVDLAQLDRRIQPTQLKGHIQAQSKPDHRINFQAQLSDPRASLNAEASYQPELKTEPKKVGTTTEQAALVRLTKFDLTSAGSRLQAQGEIVLSGALRFNAKGSMQHVDPARWVKVPAGNINADFSASGQLQPKLDVALHLSALQGQYAGQNLAGVIDGRWQQDLALTINQLDLHWGKNTLTGQGIWGNDKDQLQLAIEMPDLAAISPWLPAQQTLAGTVKAQLRLHGTMTEPAGMLDVSAQRLRYGRQWEIDSVQAKVDLARGIQGAFDGDVQVKNLRSDLARRTATDTLNANKDAGLPMLAEQISLLLKGTRAAHTIDLNSRFTATRSLSVRAAGSLGGAINPATKNNDEPLQWQGQILSANLTGKPDLNLLAPVKLRASSQAVSLSDVALSGTMGRLNLTQFDWSPDGIKTQGKWAAMDAIALAHLIRPQYAVEGDLLLDAAWNLQLKNHLQGELHMQRQSGDVRINDADGTGKAIPLGIRDLQMQLALGGVVAGSDATRLTLNASADGARLGRWQIQASSAIGKQSGGWTLPPDAALAGQVKADIPDVQWLGPWINPGLALKGKLLIDAQLAGQIRQPKYQARLSGRELEVAFASEGLLLPNGILEAVVDESHVRLNRLEFSNTVSMMPRHAQFQGINWIGQKGQLSASGDIDIRNESGNIQAQMKQFPLLQRNDRWLVVSGETNIVNVKDVWNLTGKLKADGAYFKLPKLPPPSLSGDVVVIRNKDKAAQLKAAEDANKKALKSRLDMSFDMGPRFVFVGRGLDTALAGTIRLRAADGNPMQASGSIRTVGGAYEGYGQQLAIERGILNFQGPPGNPGLNIRALRQGLAVEAGVEVVGTVAAPQVRLVSEPSVPDAEKLSWLVLGRGSDQIAGNDASLLMSAASAIFGGDGSRNIPRDVVNGLGFDEFSMGTADTGNGSKLPSQTIAGATSLGSNSGNQVVTIGKRLAPGIVLSVERGLSDASGAIKLSWQLTRRISIIGRTGNESSVDAYYTFSFN
ncbi:translocation/assembly module TamB domain-containing protein [Undibacterium sp. Jales W-56]|uniref:translocation/assembly module TamB domain-containing protein n=1 Tax=Undibacterium sp. Jales W-56 TaxID=2897325 RepID=UPI0021D0D02E|nr:translocation/assembly module TamB domain-containing protein [Undibacterium sp. Jales W-56]MCU6435641.1 translocation/assembly module TamB domain-containing protein [Undibacterium sp. Jales W-56]